MTKDPLVSVIILSYKNYHYIYEAVNSVLSQNYKNIELVITNDGSLDFNSKALSSYIKNKCGPNLKKFSINNNKVNLGTVKNINTALKLCHGDFYIIFAADDALYDNKVVANFINTFSQLPKKELLVTSQCGMYDIHLNKLIEFFVSENDKELIIKSTPKHLFGEMASRCIIPGPGNCYRKELFKKYGYFDEKYFLIEDYSASLKFSRLGIRHNFSDFISIKHRDGGVSHGNVNGGSVTSNKYDLDMINIYKNEVLPYLGLLNKSKKKEFLNRYKDCLWKYAYKYNYKNGSKAERRRFVLKNLKTITYIFFNTMFQEIINQAKGKKVKIFLTGLFLLTVYTFNIDYGSSVVSILSIREAHYWPYVINQVIGFGGLFLTVCSILLIIYTFFKKYFIQIFRFFRFII